jgi:hypothetical protein
LVDQTLLNIELLKDQEMKGAITIPAGPLSAPLTPASHHGARDDRQNGSTSGSS